MPMTQPDGAVRTLAAGAYVDAIFSSDGSRLYAVSGNTLTVIDAATGATINSFAIGTQLGAMDISQDGRYLAVVEEQPAGGAGILYRVDLTNGSVSTFNLPGVSSLHDVAFLADGSVVVSQDASAPLRVINLDTGDYWAASGAIAAQTIAVSADATYFIAQAAQITWPLYSYDLDDGSGHQLYGMPDPYAGASIPPAGSRVGAVSPDGSMVVQGMSMTVYNSDLTTHIALGTKFPDLKNAAAVTFSADGQMLYVLVAGTDEIVAVRTSDWEIDATYPVGAYALHPSEWPTGTQPLPGEMMRASDDGDFLSIITPTGIQVINLNLVIEPSNEGPDVITGGSGIDVLVGGAGADTVSGLDGNDILYSHNEDDLPNNIDETSLDTLAEQDAISGGGGSDFIYAGYGDDVDGGEDGLEGDSLFISFLGASSGITVDFSLASQTIGGGTITEIENLRWVQGSNFADTINAADNATGYTGGNRVLGMGGNDHLIAGQYTYSIDGGDGDDLVDGRPGMAVEGGLYGGAGNDTIYTTEGPSGLAFGDAGNDVIHAHVGAYGGSGNDTIFGYGFGYSSPYGYHGEEGDDTITGSEVNDSITGGSGADTLNGGAGNDALASGSVLDDYSTTPADDMGLEHDMLSGGDGDDGIWAGFGDDVDGGAGQDFLRLSFGGATAGISFDTATITSGGPATIGGGTIQNIESLQYLRATEFADHIIVSANAGVSMFHLGAGDDVITSLYGGPSIYGGDGNDLLISGGAYGQYGNIFDGAAGIDTVDYANATGSVALWLNEEGNGHSSDNFGNALMNVENVFGSAFDDYFEGNSGDNLLAGGAGNDRLDGGEGNDQLQGGDGIDTADYLNAVSGITANLSLTTGQNTGGAGIDTLSGIEGIWGSGFADTLTGSASANRLWGNVGNDALSGGDGDDELYGGQGNDGLSGGNANDYLAGEDGDDSLNGGAGDDQLEGGAGNDSLDGGAGANDWANYSNSVGAVTVNLSIAGAQFINSSAGTDSLVNIENISGSSYADFLTGNSGANLLVGGSGNDRLSGGSGIDWLTGGAGVDTFLDTAAGLAGDTITDLAVGDKIVISNASLAGFSFTLSGTTLTYTGGTLTVAGGVDGRLVVTAAAGGGVELTLVEDTRNDFNGDGHSDILWRNDNGRVTDWLGQAEGRFTGNTAITNIQVGPDWQAAGIGDFNGDGRDDVLWRKDSGALAEWLGQANGGFHGNAGVNNNVATSWDVAGVGDFNGDGRDDILWRHTDGTVIDWLGRTDGRFDSNAANANIKVGSGWQVAGVGDFNGDGRDDVLWRNDNGQLAEWLGQTNGGFHSNAGVNNNVATSWRILGIGDFNGDGRDDILWRNTDGTVTDWLGRTDGRFDGNTDDANIKVGPDWDIASIGDFNGDGRDDVIWRNDDGRMIEWLGQANGGFHGNPNANYSVDTSWHLQSPELM